jgi:hypothetical protein
MPRPRKAEAPPEPLILWWMPLVSLVAPLVYAAWKVASAGSDGLTAGIEALAWPGIGLYLAMVAVLWAGWKIELE